MKQKIIPIKDAIEERFEHTGHRVSFWAIYYAIKKGLLNAESGIGRTNTKYKGVYRDQLYERWVKHGRKKNGTR